MLRWISLTLIVCIPTLASEVAKVAPDHKYAYITQDADQMWEEEDLVCFFRNDTPITCGTVVKSVDHYAKVRLSDGKLDLRRGDSAFEAAKTRVPASTSSLEDKKKIQSAYYNISAGLNMAVDKTLEKVDFQGGFTPYWAGGIQPCFLTATTEDGTYKMQGYGAIFTLNYYSQGFFRGLWLQGGGDMYLLSDNTSGAAVQRNTPILLANIGWRETWALGFNIGIAVGARYIDFPTVNVSQLQFKKLQPAATVEFGLAF